MEAIAYPNLKETLYYERLPNGLSVYVLPKQGFQKVYATFSTKYGSVDNRFRTAGGPEQRVPDGIAHFLEHKMFEEPDGDIFSKFASQGASANAYTGFNLTTYLFSSTSHVPDNLRTLLHFVQNPYFTDENVEKEKGIITQEIKMYQDHADWRLYYGLIGAMYQSHPIRIDIAGTEASIREITKDMLYDCYHTFYHPSNMQLFAVGGVEPEALLQLVREEQSGKSFPPQGEIVRLFDAEPAEVGSRRLVTQLPVSLPKCMFGFKESLAERLSGDGLLHRELSTKLALDLLFSPSSAMYQKLYEENLISDQFGAQYNCHNDYAFSAIGGETRDPDGLVERVREEVERVLKAGFDEADFERARKKKIGVFLRMMNAPEAIAGEFTRYRFKETDLFRLLPVYESITLEEVNRRAREHFNWEQLAVSIVRSEPDV